MGSHHASGPCHRCGRVGHVARECSLHICFRCNGKGHMAWECVEGITCSRCGERGHLQRNCKNVSCHKCGRKGHISKFCSDPFVKAEEAERHERHQALSKARSSSGQVIGKAQVTLQMRAVATKGCSQKRAPGPWDGLGDLGQEKTVPDARTSLGAVGIGKRGATRSEGAFTEKVKILTVKRKIYPPEANVPRTKRRALDGVGDQEADVGGKLPLMATCVLKDEEPALWHGLVGYGSGDCREDSYSSSDVDCEYRNSTDFEGPVHSTFETPVDGGVGGQHLQLHSSVGQVPWKPSTLLSKEIVDGGTLQQTNKNGVF